MSKDLKIDVKNEFVCKQCEENKDDDEIAKLKCGHTFCWTCLDQYILKNIKNKVKCPFQDCERFITDSIIRQTLSTENIEKYENACLNNIQKSHNCLLPKCNGVIFYTDSNLQYQCQLCSLYNCVCCRAPHSFYNCTQFKTLKEKQKKSICDVELDRASQFLKKLESEKLREGFLQENNQDILKNPNAFLCCICCKSIAKGKGVILRQCSHSFCLECLKQIIVMCEAIPVKCTFCHDGIITDGEIQSLLNNEEMEVYQSKCNMLLKRNLKKYLQCKYPNCDSFYFYTDEPTNFTCMKCKAVNCVSCSVVHEYETCEEYQLKMTNNLDAKAIEKQIKEKQMMKCPDCKHLLRKIQGCNWIKCDRCFVELCWIRQMHRWGPQGRGDISGGCKCGVKRTFCHPDCYGCMPDFR